MSNSKIDLKIVLLGKEYGGKTSLVERFIHHRFNSNLPYQNTIGAAFGAKAVTTHGQTVTLGIWDTAGSERYEAMSRTYYRGAKAGILCYDLTDIQSWNRAKFWVQEIKAHEEMCKIYLCGTKYDFLENANARQAIHYQEIIDYADTINALVYQTSSKTGQNIIELFDQIASDYITRPMEIEEKYEIVGLSGDVPSEAEPLQNRLTSLCC